MRTLDEMAAKGKAKLSAKAASMKRSYSAALPRMKTGYDATPFGPTRKANYKSGVDAGAKFYHVDPDKWERNWKAKMAE